MLSEDKRIKSKEQLKEFLELEYRRFPLHGRRYISYLLQLSEGAILRRHTKLLRYTEYHMNTGHRLRGAFYWAKLMKMQNKYSNLYLTGIFSFLVVVFPIVSPL